MLRETGQYEVDMGFAREKLEKMVRLWLAKKIERTKVRSVLKSGRMVLTSFDVW